MFMVASSIQFFGQIYHPARFCDVTQFYTYSVLVLLPSRKRIFDAQKIVQDQKGNSTLLSFTVSTINQSLEHIG